MTPERLARQLQDGLDEYASHLPAAERQLRLKVSGLEGTPLGQAVSLALPSVLGISVLVTLLIACANVAILVIAQWTARARDCDSGVARREPRPHRARAGQPRLGSESLSPPTATRMDAKRVEFLIRATNDPAAVVLGLRRHVRDAAPGNAEDQPRRAAADDVMAARLFASPIRVIMT
jgi:hypothetical protein